MKDRKFDNSNEDGEFPTTECSCGSEVVLQSTMENRCVNCGAKYNGSGQMLRDDWHRESVMLYTVKHTILKTLTI